MTIDKAQLKALANEAQGQRLDWIEAGKPWPAWNSRLIELQEKLEPRTVLALLAEIERLTEQRDEARQLRDKLGDRYDDAMSEIAGLRTGFEAQNDVIAGLKAEKEALRDGANFRAIQSLRQDCEELRKDAERYRFVRNPIGTCSPLAIWNEGKMPLFSGFADAVVDEFMAKEASDGE